MLDDFRSQFARFQRLIAANDKGHPFTNFEGIVGGWEGYKPRLRTRTPSILLRPETWNAESIRSGRDSPLPDRRQ